MNAENVSLNISDSMPTLSRGMNAEGIGKACVMEYVSLLAGEPWSDHPECTHRILAEVARQINDNLPYKERQKLIPLIGRLIGTSNHTGSAVSLNVALAQWCARASGSGMAQSEAEEAAEALDDGQFSDAARAAILASLSAVEEYILLRPPPKPGAIEFLIGLIDEYDRLTGRAESRVLSDAELADLKRQVERV